MFYVVVCIKSIKSHNSCKICQIKMAAGYDQLHRRQTIIQSFCKICSVVSKELHPQKCDAQMHLRMQTITKFLCPVAAGDNNFSLLFTEIKLNIWKCFLKKSVDTVISTYMNFSKSKAHNSVENHQSRTKHILGLSLILVASYTKYQLNLRKRFKKKCRKLQFLSIFHSARAITLAKIIKTEET